MRLIDADALLGEPWHVSYNVCEISEAKANNLVMDVIGQCKSIVAHAPTIEKSEIIKEYETKKLYQKLDVYKCKKCGKEIIVSSKAYNYLVSIGHAYVCDNKGCYGDLVFYKKGEEYYKEVYVNDN